MQAPFIIVADLDTPVSAYLKLHALEPRFLLESADGGERLGRYSFLGFGRALEVTLDDAALRVGPERRTRPVGRDALLAALRDALARAPQPGRGLGELPLPGGLVGLSGFDLVRDFEGLPRRPSDRGPDAAYVAPESLLVFDHLTRRAALLHDGDEAERAALRREVIAALRGNTPAPQAPARLGTRRASLERGAFVERVGRIKHAIAAGEVYQLVLSVAFEHACELAPFEVYRALRLLNPSPYLFYCDFGDRQLVGSSPEALVRLEGRRAFLRPIAGTRPRGADEAEDRERERELLADPKELAEHVMLVDLARNDVGRVALPGTVSVAPSRVIERYSHVMHIVSGVSGVLAPEHDAFDLFAAAFPAGTVSGAPKRRAIELIDELEPTPRGFYAGTVGYFGHAGTLDQAIAIRTMSFGEGTCHYQAGAGIVADSDPEREYDEVRAKSAALARALELAEEGL